MAVDKAKLRAYADLPTSAVVPDSTLDIFCDMAALIRSEDFSGSTLSTSRLDLIELNLAAHFAVLSNEHGGFTAQVVGTSEERYRLLSDKMYGLGSTRFGQAAISLDTSGTLPAMATSPIKAQFEVISPLTTDETLLW